MIDRIRPWISRSVACIAVLACITVWYLPLLTITRYAWSGSGGGDSSLQSAAPLAAPPSWFDAGSPLARWPELLFRSLRLSVLSAISATFAGTIFAFLMVRCRWRFSRPVRFLWSLGVFLPLPVVATVWLGAFSNLGRSQAFGLSSVPLISGWSAAWIVHTIAALPIVVTILASAFERTDPDLEDFARLRSSKFRAISSSTVRTILPAIRATVLIVLIATAGDMTVTDLVQERTFAEETYLQAQMGDGLASAARTALPITAIVATAILAWTWFEISGFGTMVGPGFREVTPAPWYSAGAGKRAGAIVILSVGLFGVVPLVSLMWRAGRSGGMASIERLPSWSPAALGRNLADAAPDLTDTLYWTLSLSLCVAVIGTGLAWCMVSSLAGSRAGRIALALGAAMGLAVPGPVAGMAILWLWMPFARLYDSPFVVVAAILFRFLGIAVFLLWAASKSISRELDEMSKLDGITGYERFVRLEWPVMASSAGVSLLMLFAFAAGELPATNMTVPPGVEMMSVRLWSLMHTGMESHLAAFVLLLSIVLSSFFAVLALLGAAVLRRFVTGSRMIE